MLIHLCRYPVIVCSHSALSDGSRLSTRAMSVSDRSEADSAAKAGRAVERNDDTEEEQDMVTTNKQGGWAQSEAWHCGRGRRKTFLPIFSFLFLEVDQNRQLQISFVFVLTHA